MLKVVLFDAGETLIRLRGSVGEVYAAAALRYGVRTSVAELNERFRVVFAQAPPLCFPDARAGEILACEQGWWRRIVKQVFADEPFADFEAFFAELFAYFARSANWEVFGDVEPTLQNLRSRGLRLGVVSNFDARLFAIFDGLNLTRYFDTIVVSGRAGAAKPDPRIFRIALERLRVTAAEALHVGDSEREDRQGALAAGLRALRIDRGKPREAPEVIGSLADLVDRLSSI